MTDPHYAKSMLELGKAYLESDKNKAFYHFMLGASSLLPIDEDDNNYNLLCLLLQEARVSYVGMLEQSGQDRFKYDYSVIRDRNSYNYNRARDFADNANLASNFPYKVALYIAAFEACPHEVFSWQYVNLVVSNNVLLKQDSLHLLWQISRKLTPKGYRYWRQNWNLKLLWKLMFRTPK